MLGAWKRLGLMAAAALAVPGAALADVVVLRADGPSAARIKAGTRVRDGTQIRLQAGDRLLVLEGRGTRMLQGPTTYVAGGNRVAKTTLVSIWRQVDARRRTGGVRGPGQLRADRLSALVDEAVIAAAAGDYARSNELLGRVESQGYGQRVQCRVVSNLQLHNKLAEGLALPADATAGDPCAELPVPANLAEDLATLNAERQQLLDAIGALTAQ